MLTKNVKAWINAFRLRTLPLSVAGIILGSALAYYYGAFSMQIFILALITTLFLQILSNLANDYGDYISGVDNKNRIGPERAIQGGSISPKTMKRAIFLFIALCLFTGIWLIALAFKDILSPLFILFLLTGIIAIGAAIKYTVGKKPFGYKGFGDIMVFIFFGIVSVYGTYFLHTQALNSFIILPSISLGLLSTGVLNVNNMRDIKNDKESGKITLAVKLGASTSKVYHFSLIILAIVSLAFFLYHTIGIKGFILLILPIITLTIHLFKIFTLNDTKIDPELKSLSLSTLLIAVIISVGLILF